MTRPQMSIYHPNAKGTGSAIKLELHPAREGVCGSIFLRIAKEGAHRMEEGWTRPLPSFEWESAATVRLDISDLSQMLQVFRGIQESIADGKGLYHRSATTTKIIKLEHRIEPTPGYLLEVHEKPAGKDESCRHWFQFTQTEALALMVAIEQSMGLLAFGVPAEEKEMP